MNPTGLQLYWLYSTTFVDLVATSLLVPYLPIYLRAFGLPRLFVGIVSSIYPSVQMFSSPAVGFYSDKYGQKTILITSLLLCSSAYYLLASTRSVFVILLSRVILGLVKHTQTICKAVYLTQNDQYSMDGFRGLGAAEALGYMLGPVIGAHYIGQEDGFQYLCKITTALFVLNALIAFLVLPADKLKGISTKQRNFMVDFYGSSSLVDFFLLWDILVLKLTLCFSLSLFYTNYHVIITEYLNMSPSMVGYINSFQGFICVIVSLFASKISDLYVLNHYYLKLSFGFFLLCSTLFCIGLVSDSGSFVIYLIPLTYSSSLLRIQLTEALISRSVTNNKASIIGLENSIATIAGLTSPFIFESFNYLGRTSPVNELAFSISGFGSIFSLVLYFIKEKLRCRMIQNGKKS